MWLLFHPQEYSKGGENFFAVETSTKFSSRLRQEEFGEETLNHCFGWRVILAQIDTKMEDKVFYILFSFLQVMCETVLSFWIYVTLWLDIFKITFIYLCIYLYFVKNVYCYSIKVACLFSPSLHPSTPAKPTTLPRLHPPPRFLFIFNF